MKITHIEHIGIAVKNLNESISFYEKVFGLTCYAVEEVESQKVKTAFFKVGDVKIELLEATAEDSPISNFIEKTGGGIHHIAFSVEDVRKALLEVKEAGCRLIDKEPRKGAEGLNIGFIHPKYTQNVLTELCSE